MKYAVINKETNVVENCIMWDGDESKWKCPDKYFLVESLNAGIGDDYNVQTKEFSRKLSLLKPPESPELKKEIIDLYNKSKVELNSSVVFVNAEGTLEGING